MLIADGIRDQEALRRSFNALAKRTFGIDFEPWYQNGFWADSFVPHCVVIDGEVVANVSVSRMEMVVDGEEKVFYQIGTVMTAPEHRGNGYSRMLLEYILAKYKEACDGFFLFANRSVLAFYPKFGFESAPQYHFTKSVCNDGRMCVEKIDSENPETWKHLLEVYGKNQFKSRIQVKNGGSILMFYVPGENIYYHRSTDTYIVAEMAGKQLYLREVFSSSNIKLEDVISFFGEGVKEVMLAFTPENTEAYQAVPVSQEEDTFFTTGELLRSAKREKLCIPILFHT